MRFGSSCQLLSVPSYHEVRCGANGVMASCCGVLVGLCTSHLGIVVASAKNHASCTQYASSALLFVALLAGELVMYT